MNSLSRSIRALIFVAAVFLPTACTCDKIYIAADRFEKSVGSQYLEYVKNDPELTETQKMEKRLNVALFRKAIDEHKESK